MPKRAPAMISALLFAFFTIPVFAQSNKQKLDELFNKVSTSQRMHFNGIVIVAENQNILYKNTKGYSDISKQKSITATTNFSLASLSKIFTAIAVMQLKQNRKIDLNDALIKYLPDFPFPEITIKQILSHTSGLPEVDIFRSYHLPGEKSLTNQDIIPALKNATLLSKPGTQWHYSSIGFGLLALLVEKVSHQSFKEYIQENICNPAGLKGTYVDVFGASQPDSSKAICYVNPPYPSENLKKENALKEDKQDPLQTLVGPGLIVSNVNDLLKLDAALYTDVLLNANSKDDMFTPAKLNDGSFAQLEHAPIYNGLGWGIDIDNSTGKIVSHNGGSPGMSTIFMRNIDKKQTVIVLENTDNMSPVFFGVNAMNILNNKPPAHFRMD
jgi:CubicO group peptidase (beta-lactamase class C family)